MRFQRLVFSLAMAAAALLPNSAQALGCWVCPHAYDTCYYYAETNYQAWNDGCIRMYAANDPRRGQCQTEGAIRYSNDIAQCEADREQCYDWCDSTEKPPRENCPLVIDLDKRGIRFTSAQNGVAFDIDGDGTPNRIGWTAADAAEGFLVLDRNGNGVIDSGRELFGDSAPQGLSAEPNGFRALELLDRNVDGLITAEDPIFPALQIWVDANHDGASDPTELSSLADHGIEAIDLDYRTSKRQDANGNELRLRSRVRLSDGSFREVIDVFFASAQ